MIEYKDDILICLWLLQVMVVVLKLPNVSTSLGSIT